MAGIRNAGVTLLAIVLIAFILWDVYGSETEARGPSLPSVTIVGGSAGLSTGPSSSPATGSSQSVPAETP